jgi:hypothetical protein
MKFIQFVIQVSVLGAAALIVGCSDNSGTKAELSALQASYYSALATNSAYSTALASDSTKLANGASYRSCMTSATTDAARTACNQISF